jgi:arylsulfatase A-like enzyme
MTIRTSVHVEADPVAWSSAQAVRNLPGPFAVLILSVWCGLVAGLLEVGITALRKHYVDRNHFYWMSHHFVWMVPLDNLLIFFAIGVLLSLIYVCGRRGQWLATRLLGTVALLPLFWAAFPRIYGFAGFLLALGVAMRMVPALERRAAGLRWLVQRSFPVAAAALVLLAAFPCGADWLGERREASRPVPQPGSANVLLIVLDTVGASHLSCYGNDRRTTPSLEELASRGARFERAQATSPWTLPSHASMFTGRWPHELFAGWLTPLDGSYPTLAEFLRSRGYSTAGFAANYAYCASDSGLARGFTHYRDFIFPRLTALRMAVLVDRSVDGLTAVDRFLEDWLDLEFLKTPARKFWWLFKQDRKEAAVVNREFLAWLSRRQQPERPFFAFLNLYDAHYPYQLPPDGVHRFSTKPRNDRELANINDWILLIRRGVSARQISFARDAYEDCITELDEQLGRLIDELGHRSILDHTWVIIAADHGENFGEHAGVFLHGATLYQTERHVPLLFIPPTGRLEKQVVTEAVSLRDLPATIVDVLGLTSGSPFPGSSLARFWKASSPADSAPSNQVLSEVVPLDPLDPNPPLERERRWPLAALTDGDWTYIRREGEVREELFHVRDDAVELHNVAGDPANQRTVERMRQALDRLTAGPLTPERFPP